MIHPWVLGSNPRMDQTDQLGVDSDLAFQLAALALQASYGDFVDTSLTHSQLKKSSLLPTSVLRDHPSLLYCEERVAAEHRQLVGLSRGDAILRFMREVESLPTYGIHYYDVKDRNDLPWYIGINNRGISQYDYLDKRKPRRVFLWRQLENIYFRERKFSIEVLDPKRVCVSRRSLGSSSASVTVHVWFAESQALCKAIWSMAIAQHQFYLDRKALRSEEQGSTGCDMPELAVDLSRSCLSLSTHSSSSNLSRSGSHSSLHQHSHTESGSSESLEAARLEMLEALKLRKSGLQEKLSAKTEELRLLCLREGELTGELPPEYPLVPGQPPPTVRKRVGTSFALDETIINKIINKQEETVSALELECEIMGKITSAALRLANESTARKVVRKQRKISYQQSARRLRELELKLKQAKSKAVATASTLPKQKKKPRPLSDSEGIEDSGITGSLSSSAGSGQESPRDIPPLQSPHPSPSLNNTLTPHDSSDNVRAQRDRSPHRTRGSAPASPYRSAASVSSSSSGGGGGNGEAGGSVHNTTMTSSSSSRPSSPSRPSSGYIPNSVYACSQYRSTHFPTLSTRSSSRATSASSHNSAAKSSGDSVANPPAYTTVVNSLSFITITTIVTSEANDGSKGSNGEENTVEKQCDTSLENTNKSTYELCPRSDSAEFENGASSTLLSTDDMDSRLQVLNEALSSNIDYEYRDTCVDEKDSLRELSDTLSMALREKEHEHRPSTLRQSRSVPRELDPSNLSYEAHLTRDPLNLCVDNAALSLDAENLSFPGGLYNLSSRQRASSQSMSQLDSTGSSSCSSPAKVIASAETADKPPPHSDRSSLRQQQALSPSFHHPHHRNHLPHLHSSRQHRMKLHDRSAPPPPLLV
ncbi:FERM central domain [Trinorchestia longiramus]|nr:FERM central domain [Trinorchestia longiramus]